jgi:Na+/H+-dicarboxylate symporter
MPVEGVVLLNSVDMLWDYAATVLNSTGYIASTTLLPREPSIGAAPEVIPVTIHDGIAPR